MNKIPLKNLIKEKKNYQRQFWVLIAIVFIPILCIFSRLVYLQIVDHKHYQTMSTKNLLSIVSLPAARGMIYDRNHILLAYNKQSYAVEIIPERTYSISQTIKQLQKIVPLNNDDIKDFYIDMHQHHPYQAIAIGPNLTPTQIAQISVKQYLLPGVIIVRKPYRTYPLGSIMAPVIGYLGKANSRQLSKLSANYNVNTTIGKAGIEKSYEQILRGTVGVNQIETNVNGRTVKSLQNTPPVAGSNLTLTIDSGLQTLAMQALGKQKGAVVAIDPQNGEILALASKPSYQPNLLINGMSQKTYHDLFTTGKETLFNKATQGLYSVASTIKPFIAVGSLSMGIITPQQQISDPGWFKIKNTHHIYHDWKLGGHGMVDVTHAIMVSCDTYFYTLGAKLGINRLDTILQAFGFGSKTGIDLPHEKAGIIPSPAWKLQALGAPWYEGDTVETAIGQEYQLATPLELAMATATLANQGQIIKPHLFLSATNSATDPTQNITNANQGKNTLNASSTIIPVFFPKNEKAINKAEKTINKKLILNNISQTDWKIISRAMQKVITNPYGTGLHFGRNPGYTVAAKTGTSQVFGHQRNEESTQANLPEKLRNNHLFIAYAPVAKPQIALAVIVEHNAIAAKISRKLLDYYLITQDHLKAKKKKPKDSA